MSTFTAPTTPNPTPDAFIVDRRRRPPAQFGRNRQNARKNQKCFVCGLPGCWSTNHMTSERLRSLSKNKSACAYIMESLQEQNNDDSPLTIEQQDEPDDILVNLKTIEVCEGNTMGDTKYNRHAPSSTNTDDVASIHQNTVHILRVHGISPLSIVCMNKRQNLDTHRYVPWNSYRHMLFPF